MSKYRGNEDECPHCAIKYRDFRTGLTYRQVFEMMLDGSDDPADWRYKRRNTVLGYWFALKQERWRQHLEDCAKQAAYERRRRSRRAKSVEVPF